MVVTDVETGGIDKGQSGQMPQIRMEEGTQRGQAGTDALDKTIVGRKSGKVAPMMRRKKLQIKMLEGSKIRVMEINQNGHDFTYAQAGGAVALAYGIGQQQVVFRKAHKIIEFAKMFC